MISPLLLVFYLSIKYFPIFACVDAPISIIGHLLGTLYSTFLWVSYIKSGLGPLLYTHCMFVLGYNTMFCNTKQILCCGPCVNKVQWICFCVVFFFPYSISYGIYEDVSVAYCPLKDNNVSTAVCWLYVTCFQIMIWLVYFALFSYGLLCPLEYLSTYSTW